MRERVGQSVGKDVARRVCQFGGIKTSRISNTLDRTFLFGPGRKPGKGSSGEWADLEDMVVLRKIRIELLGLDETRDTF